VSEKAREEQNTEHIQIVLDQAIKKGLKSRIFVLQIKVSILQTKMCLFFKIGNNLAQS